MCVIFSNPRDWPGISSTILCTAGPGQQGLATCPWTTLPRVGFGGSKRSVPVITCTRVECVRVAFWEEGRLGSRGGVC